MTSLTGRNNIFLTTVLDGTPASHFKLREFENAAGLAMVHESTLFSLEQTRRDLCALHGESVLVIIADAVRTDEDLARLAAKYGWMEEGGPVARHSRHLAEFGGIAVDLVARVVRTRTLVPQRTLGRVCRLYFDWVKDDYADGHVHADNRIRAR